MLWQGSSLYLQHKSLAGVCQALLSTAHDQQQPSGVTLAVDLISGCASRNLMMSGMSSSGRSLAGPGVFAGLPAQR